MKIRIISLCFLLLVSVMLSAQTDKKEKERAKEKEAAEQVDKKDGAKKAADEATKEAAKLAAKRAKENAADQTASPHRFIERVEVQPRETYVVRDNTLEIGTLVMGHRATILITYPSSTLIIGHATVAQQCQILGKGKNGTNGSNGRSGEPAPQLPGARDGGKGSNGGDGQNAPDLKLFLGGINRGGRLGVTLLGGTGGRGGNGGDGGTKNIRCQPKPTGTNGGDAGAGGSGGAGGELVLVVGEGVSSKVINYRSIAGKSGTGGDVGNAGLVIMTCTGYGITRSRPGNSGLFNNPRIIEFPPNTNPDFLEFPRKVPTPTTSTEIPIKLPTNSTYATIDIKLKSALKACGYTDLNYRSYKDGFVIFTRMENITIEGVPLSEPDRFNNEEVIFHDDFSLLSFIKSFIKGNSAYARIIVFFVTSEGISYGQKGITRSDAIEWFKNGISKLPSEIGKRPYTEAHDLVAYIYEFEKNENGGEASFSESSKVGDVEKHLTSTNVWPILTKN